MAISSAKRDPDPPPAERLEHDAREDPGEEQDDQADVRGHQRRARRVEQRRRSVLGRAHGVPGTRRTSRHHDPQRTETRRARGRKRSRRCTASDPSSVLPQTWICQAVASVRSFQTVLAYQTASPNMTSAFTGWRAATRAVRSSMYGRDDLDDVQDQQSRRLADAAAPGARDDRHDQQDQDQRGRSGSRSRRCALNEPSPPSCGIADPASQTWTTIAPTTAQATSPWMVLRFMPSLPCPVWPRPAACWCGAAVRRARSGCR